MFPKLSDRFQILCCSFSDWLYKNLFFCDGYQISRCQNSNFNIFAIQEIHWFVIKTTSNNNCKVVNISLLYLISIDNTSFTNLDSIWSWIPETSMLHPWLTWCKCVCQQLQILFPLKNWMYRVSKIKFSRKNWL